MSVQLIEKMQMVESILPVIGADAAVDLFVDVSGISVEDARDLLAQGSVSVLAAVARTREEMLAEWNRIVDAPDHFS